VSTSPPRKLDGLPRKRDGREPSRRFKQQDTGTTKKAKGKRQTDELRKAPEIERERQAKHALQRVCKWAPPSHCSVSKRARTCVEGRNGKSVIHQVRSHIEVVKKQGYARFRVPGHVSSCLTWHQA